MNTRDLMRREFMISKVWIQGLFFHDLKFLQNEYLADVILWRACSTRQTELFSRISLTVKLEEEKFATKLSTLEKFAFLVR